MWGLLRRPVSKAFGVTTEARSKKHLRGRFETCYPFHPAALSVFQRKWMALSQYQQTRGTLAMLAQWISWAYHTGFTEARREPLITLGSAPLEVPELRSVVLGQLGESRLVAAIDSDIAGANAHALALDVDTRGALRNIHRWVGITIFFESSGGQVELLLAWRRVVRESAEGTLGTDFDRAERAEIQTRVAAAKRGGEGRGLGWIPVRHYRR